MEELNFDTFIMVNEKSLPGRISIQTSAGVTPNLTLVDPKY